MNHIGTMFFVGGEPMICLHNCTDCKRKWSITARDRGPQQVRRSRFGPTKPGIQTWHAARSRDPLQYSSVLDSSAPPCPDLPLPRSEQHGEQEHDCPGSPFAAPGVSNRLAIVDLYVHSSVPLGAPQSRHDNESPSRYQHGQAAHPVYASQRPMGAIGFASLQDTHDAAIQR